MGVRKRLTPRMQTAQALSRKIKKPSLLAEVEYRARSANGRLRLPTFEGIREDL
jgi:bifunctional non-homologous end joining protein LigD